MVVPFAKKPDVRFRDLSGVSLSAPQEARIPIPRNNCILFVRRRLAIKLGERWAVLKVPEPDLAHVNVSDFAVHMV